MKIVTRFLFLPLFISAFLLTMKCVSGGPGSSSEVSDATGTLLGPGGNGPACNALVVIRSLNYLESIPALHKKGAGNSWYVDSTRTDNRGRYQFKVISDGLYCIEGIGSDGKKAMRDSVMIEEGNEDCSWSDTLKQTATLQGTINPDTLDNMIYVRIFGLGEIAATDSNDFFTLKNLPAGKLRLQIAMENVSPPVYDTLEVITEPGKTVSIDSLLLLNSKHGLFGPGNTFQMRYDAGVSMAKYHAVGQQTKDGGYIVVTYKAEDPDFSQIMLLKTDATGAKTWTRTFPHDNAVTTCSMQQTSDGGFIITGAIYSGPLEKVRSRIFLLKADAAGGGTWEKSFSGVANGNNYGNCVRQTNDGGYVVIGTIGTNNSHATRTIDEASSLPINQVLSDSSDLPDTNDIYLIKTDAGGNLVWERRFGLTDKAEGNSVQQTTDGGYIITGTISSGTNSVIYLLKTNGAGGMAWIKTFGDSRNYAGYSVQQTRDRGYIIAGYTQPCYGAVNDACLIKTDSLGNLSWTRSFGGDDDDGGNSVQQTNDGGYIIVGYTCSYGAGGSDVYLIKTDAAGNSTWKKTFGTPLTDYGYSVQQTADGGYFIAGYSFDYSIGETIYAVKTDKNGVVK